MLPAPKTAIRVFACSRRVASTSLSDAEAREDPPEQLVGAHLSCDLPERLLRIGELLRDELTGAPFEKQSFRFVHMSARAAQCIDVPPPGAERSTARCRKAGALLEVHAK